MENQPKLPFDKATYSREYQKRRYHSDPEFREKQLSHVKKLYQKNKAILDSIKLKTT